MNIYEKLLEIQNKLKAPKSQWNDFGKYHYRSCEDILEAVKPLCQEQKLLLYISDTTEDILDRVYIKATAHLINIEDPKETIEVTAEARECSNKKGMDESQITGTASSYARKYALGGLFNIDDTKDADSNEYHKRTTETKKTTNSITDKPISDDQLRTFKKWITNKGLDQEQVDNVLKTKGYNSIEEIKNKDYRSIVMELDKETKQGVNTNE